MQNLQFCVQTGGQIGGDLKGRVGVFRTIDGGEYLPNHIRTSQQRFDVPCGRSGEGIRGGESGW